MDTGIWVALADRREDQHAAVATRMRRLKDEGRMLVTTSHVIGETYTALRRHLGSGPALAFLAAVRSSRTTRRVLASQALEVAAEALLAQYADQDFSYVDAVSFVTMRQLGIREAFALDQHFVVAGFTLIGDAS